MSEDVKFSDTQSADLLNAIRKHLAERKAGQTSEESFTPNFIRLVESTFTLTDAVTLDNNKISFADTFNLSDEKYLRVVNTGKYVVGADNNDQYLNGKRFVSDGASQINIIKRSKLQSVSEHTNAVRAKLAGFTGSIRQLVHMRSAGNAGFRVQAEASSNDILVDWYDGAALISSQTFSFTPDTFFTIVATFRSGNQDLYKDGSLADSDTVVATLGPSTNDMGYGGQFNGTQRLASGDIVEQLVVIDTFVDSTFATRFNNGYADLTHSNDRIPGMVSFSDVGLFVAADTRVTETGDERVTETGDTRVVEN